MNADSYKIKSFKHNGHLHRTWLDNWFVPHNQLLANHAEQAVTVLINNQTPVIEANGKQWVSKSPAVSFFVPDQWFNIVGLLEETGIRYYCNIASPPLLNDRLLTYIDYDLDVIVTSNQQISILDEDEYEENKIKYHYDDEVEQKVQQGLNAVLELIRQKETFFRDSIILDYYELWKNRGAQ